MNDAIVCLPKVAIFCLVYNHDPYLRNCFEGFVMQQTNFPFVAIVHDDCSTDSSTTIIHEYEAKYPHIFKPIYEVENQYSKHDGSLECIMNEAINATGAKYVALCEGDDYWVDPWKLQKQVDILDTYPEYTMCYSNYKNVDNVGEIIVWPNRKNNIKRSFSGDVFAELLKGNFIQTCTMLFRKEIIDDIEYQARLDYEISLQCALKGKCFFLDNITANYRLQPNSAIHTMNEKLKYISIDIWSRYVGRYLNQTKYKRVFFEHVHIISIIAARMISMVKGKNQTEIGIVQTILKSHPILYVYIPLGLIIRVYNVIRKYISK